LTIGPKAAKTRLTKAMPRYISQHTIACITRQYLEALIKELQRDGKTVKCVRFVSDSLEGKLLCEVEAPDKESVIAFLNAHQMRPQWVMRVEQEWT
jgi:hypothetical protein